MHACAMRFNSEAMSTMIQPSCKSVLSAMKSLFLICMLIALAGCTHFDHGALDADEEGFAEHHTALAANSREARWGRFEGRVVTEWLRDGRFMKLEEPFTFVEVDGRRWTAPKGARVNGASIPRIAWSLVGSPFDGLYREASVVHDVACDPEHQYLGATWQQAHLMFYRAMRARGVDIETAKSFYAAVYHFGPRWEEVTQIKGLYDFQVDQLVDLAKSANPDGRVISGSEQLLASVDRTTIESTRSFERPRWRQNVEDDPAQREYESAIQELVKPPSQRPSMYPKPPGDLKVFIRVATPRTLTTESQLEQLVGEIKALNLNLEEIRRFRPKE